LTPAQLLRLQGAIKPKHDDDPADGDGLETVTVTALVTTSTDIGIEEELLNVVDVRVVNTEVAEETAETAELVAVSVEFGGRIDDELFA
jgi:hypothetical protein